jgi:FkbM family methyltransferase
MIKDLLSCRSSHVFSRDKFFHKLACLGTTIELLYRIKTGKKLEEGTKMFNRFIKPDSTCLDIGAAYGRNTFLMAKLADRGAVHSFEPEDYSWRVLSNIVKLCRLKNVTVNHVAVYETPGHAELFIPQKDSGKYVPHLSYLAFKPSDEYGIKEKIETLTIDDYCRQKGVGKIDFIKCDIEGAELFSLRGAEKTIAASRPVFFLEIIDTNLIHFNLGPSQVADFFTAHKYRSFIVHDNKLTPCEVNSKHIDYFFIPAEKKDY